MPSSVHVMAVAQNQWKGDIKAMIADGRLTKVNVVNGKTLYALDRKKLGMPEWDIRYYIRYSKNPKKTQDQFRYVIIYVMSKNPSPD